MHAVWGLFLHVMRKMVPSMNLSSFYCSSLNQINRFIVVYRCNRHQNDKGFIHRYVLSNPCTSPSTMQGSIIRFYVCRYTEYAISVKLRLFTQWHSMDIKRSMLFTISYVDKCIPYFPLRIYINCNQRFNPSLQWKHRNELFQLIPESTT